MKTFLTTLVAILITVLTFGIDGFDAYASYNPEDFKGKWKITQFRYIKTTEGYSYADTEIDETFDSGNHEIYVNSPHNVDRITVGKTVWEFGNKVEIKGDHYNYKMTYFRDKIEIGVPPTKRIYHIVGIYRIQGTGRVIMVLEGSFQYVEKTYSETYRRIPMLKLVLID